MDTLQRPDDMRKAFFYQISRVIVGTLSMGLCGLSAMKIGCLVTARYSQRRMVTDAFTGNPRPIMSFRTQHGPIVTVLAQIHVLQAFTKKCLDLFTNRTLDLGIRHCVAAIGKIILLSHCQEALLSLSERCGAQGLFESNQLSVMHVSHEMALFACTRLELTVLLGSRISEVQALPKGTFLF